MSMTASEYYRLIRRDRDEWKNSMPQVCCGCGRAIPRKLLQIHEIERRSQAQRTWGHRSNYLLLCAGCHAGDFDSMPHADQLARKLLHDPEHFDLNVWLKIRDPELRAPQRVTLREVLTSLLTHVKSTS
jgi:hypothetical protein